MRAEKKQLVQDIRGLMESSPYVFVITYKGLTAAQFGKLRKTLAEAQSQCHVVPNRLLRRAAVEGGLAILTDVPLGGDSALISGGSDPVAVAKRLCTFMDGNQKVSFKVGVLGGKLCSPTQARSLATVPPVEVLQAQLLGLLQAPMTQLVGVLNAKVASVLYVLSAYLSKKEKAA